ncbi:alpha/beta hydrolase [Flavobacteriaceae bacterium 14752]|nr:alpha/beta hydrolase [Flavobacteriaceae bacterium 14752]
MLTGFSFQVSSFYPTYYQLPTTNYMLLTTHYQLLTTH